MKGPTRLWPLKIGLRQLLTESTSLFPIRNHPERRRRQCRDCRCDSIPRSAQNREMELPYGIDKQERHQIPLSDNILAARAIDAKTLAVNVRIQR